MSDVPLRDHLDEVLRLRDVATVQLRECNPEAIRSADRMQEARLQALSARLDHMERSHTAALDRIARLVYVGLGIALALEFLIPLIRK